MLFIAFTPVSPHLVSLLQCSEWQLPECLDCWGFVSEWLGAPPFCWPTNDKKQTQDNTYVFLSAPVSVCVCVCSVLPVSRPVSWPFHEGGLDLHAAPLCSSVPAVQGWVPKQCVQGCPHIVQPALCKWTYIIILMYVCDLIT